MFPQIFYIDAVSDIGHVHIGGVEYLYSSFVVPCHQPVLIFKIEQDIPDTDNVLGFRVGFRVKHFTLPTVGCRDFGNTGFVFLIFPVDGDGEDEEVFLQVLGMVVITSTE